MNIANGSTWNLTDDEDEASGMSLMRMAKAPAATAKGLTLNGGKTEAETGFINLQKRLLITAVGKPSSTVMRVQAIRLATTSLAIPLSTRQQKAPA